MPRHTLGDLQHAIMAVLWERGEATAAEVHEALREERGLAPTTIATMLHKMEDKGVVAHRAEGRQFVYRPTVSEDLVRRSMVGELVERLFGGDPKALVAHLVSEHEIAPGELGELRRRVGARGGAGGSDGAARPLAAHLPRPQHPPHRRGVARPPGPRRATTGPAGGRAARRPRRRLRDGQPAGRARRAADRRRARRAGGAPGAPRSRRHPRRSPGRATSGRPLRHRWRGRPVATSSLPPWASAAVAAAAVRWRAGLAVAWAVLVVIALARLLVAASRLRRVLRGRRPLRPGELAPGGAAGRARARPAPPRPLSEAPRLSVPLATGVLRPEVCLPSRALGELGADEQVALCAHELAHVARHDPAWVLLARLAEALAPVQPMNAWARRRLQDLAECLSDDLAVSASGPSPRPRPLARGRRVLDARRAPPSSRGGLGRAQRPQPPRPSRGETHGPRPRRRASPPHPAPRRRRSSCWPRRS